MAISEKNEEQGVGGELPGQPFTGEQATVLQQLLRFQSDIEAQGRQVVLAAKPIAEALDNGGSVSPEMMSHLKAQLLLTHLQLDELEQLLDSIA